MVVSTVTLDATPVDLCTAAAIEAAEARAWADLYAAAPADWSAAAGLGAQAVGGAFVVRWAATGRRYFSRTIGLGVFEPANRAAIEEILDGYDRAGITRFLLQSLPHCRPAEYESWLREFELEPFDAQDRVVRDGRPLTVAPTLAGDRELPVERVTHASTGEWVEFIERVYRLETGPWLPRLIGRPGCTSTSRARAARSSLPAACTSAPMARPGSAWTAPCRVSRPMTMSPTLRSARSSSPTDSSAAPARSSLTSKRPQINRRRLPTNPSDGSGSRGRTSEPTGRCADARIDLEVRRRSRRASAPLRRDARRDPARQDALARLPPSAGRDRPGRYLPDKGRL